ncbi:MAG: hypothetical protein M1814_003843 [Vezdaea aestivalis]|nr:MAG: hypothetical protein M1814_003843 [Vezdaea aestivalis]
MSPLPPFSNTTTITAPHLQLVHSTSLTTQQTCLALLTLTSTAPALPTSEDAPSSLSLEISRATKDLHNHMAMLRGQNREALMGARRTRALTADARAEVDTLHLQLANLRYEMEHLRGEILGCEGFDHKYLHLPVVPEEEFKTLFPEWDPFESEDDELMRARIKFEHSEREALEQERQALLKDKQVLVAKNKRRREGLAGLDKELEGFVDAVKPIQKLFEQEY